MLPTMATLKDIADICGVSTATVSYVLSGRGTEKRITEQTQQEIRKAAEIPPAPTDACKKIKISANC